MAHGDCQKHMNAELHHQICEIVEGFDIDPSRYQDCTTALATVSGAGENTGNRVYSLGAPHEIPGKIQIIFREVSNSVVFLGKNLKGAISISVHGSDSLIYIGNNCQLKDLAIRSFQSNDVIVVGNQVTTTSKNVWISGNGAGQAKPSLLIGDDCMFSYDVVLRNSDGHPVISMEDDRQLNQPSASLVIEPHVWIGERTAILKDVVIGACSVVALGAVVTKSMPRQSLISGVPAKAARMDGKIWSRTCAELHKKRAKYYLQKFPAS